MHKQTTGVSNSSIDLLAPHMAADPFATYAQLREHSPVCKVEPNGLWAISRYEDVKFALKRHDLFSSARTNELLRPDWFQYEYVRSYLIGLEDPPHHTQHRIPFNKYFIKRAIEELAPFMRDTAQTLLTRFGSADPVEFLENFTHPYVSSAIGHLLGIEGHQNEAGLRQWVNLLEQGPFLQSDPNIYGETLKVSAAEQERFFTEVVKSCRQQPGDDFISKLLAAASFPFTDAEMANIIELLTQAGYQTVVHLLSHALMVLAQRPDLWQQLVAAPERIPAFVDEMLRYNSSVHLLFRRALAPVTLSGVTIPEGAPVVLILASANRDPAHFSNPDEVDISRRNIKDHIAFGYGIHHCLGAALARAETRVALEVITKTFRTLSISDVDRLPWFYTLFAHGVSSLPVVFQPVTRQ